MRTGSLASIVALVALGMVADQGRSCLAQQVPTSVDDPLQRMIAAAHEREDWKNMTSASEKMRLIREVALSYDVVSNPVSDRYLITRLAGPVDMVHFFGLAIPMANGSRQREPLLMYHWRDEGGEDFEAGRTRSFPTEAHPDDLPSNALGALFGEEIQARNDDPDFNLEAALREFLTPLRIVEDVVAKRFSHRLIVMGLTEQDSNAKDTSRREWFTAVPLFVLPLVDPPLAKSVREPRAALAAAGFALAKVEGRELAIVRMPAQK